MNSASVETLGGNSQRSLSRSMASARIRLSFPTISCEGSSPCKNRTRADSTLGAAFRRDAELT
jgi:hypothetical protein